MSLRVGSETFTSFWHTLARNEHYINNNYVVEMSALQEWWPRLWQSGQPSRMNPTTDLSPVNNFG